MPALRNNSCWSVELAADAPLTNRKTASTLNVRVFIGGLLGGMVGKKGADRTRQERRPNIKKLTPKNQ
jgi:hypothetical protein